MPVVINLFLAAFQPITFFLPCAAIILGSGLAALNGVVDGPLFVSLLMLTVLAQITFNLAQDFQKAFLTHAPAFNASKPGSNIQMAVRQQMLKLMLGCYFTLVLGLTLLCHFSIGGSVIGYALIAITAVLMLLILRTKTRSGSKDSNRISTASIIGQFLLVGFIPVIVSYHLHTSDLSIYLVLFAVCCGVLSLLALFAEQLCEQIRDNTPVASDNLPAVIAKNIIWQKSIIISVVVLTGGFIYLSDVPVLSGIFILALPSLIATVATIEHLPEEDIAVSQKTKVAIACFAFWVLFIVGMML
ncbi:hypothetical protein [Thalassotalea sp. ND16A]|uniref:hypothetical protein n=1 Tax=Thalassotalea sp. ND16A TaxID=1535422 RepID=UPI00051A3194|nr:hypothetical protein [Thalassotalea sp. ND16A]KGJ99216.1 hypothetical protein ND16A_0366 [Thalassotalea sp. ND16A]